MTQEIRGVHGAQATGGMQQVGEGYLGKHHVALAGQPPIRLDEIGTSKIPFQGFRKATRVERANVGVRQQANVFLKSLMGSVHTLDATSMLKSLNTMESYLGRLAKLGALSVAEHDERVLSLLAPEVESLDNASLQSLYATLVSRDLGVLRSALEQEARAVPEQKGLMMSHLGTLMDLEALVVSEVSRRMAAESLPEAEAAQIPTLTETYGGVAAGQEAAAREVRGDDMGAAMLGAMVDTAAGASMREASDAASVQTFASRHRKLNAVEAREIGDMLRQAELTINIDSRVLFGEEGTDGGLPIDGQGFSIQNMFARREAGAAVGDDYASLREHVEDHLLPQVEGHTTSRNRPVYGALNVSGNVRGGAGLGSYGDSVVVLKESVKKLATFTLDDTFNMPTLTLSPEREGAFLAQVRSLGDRLAPATAAALEDEGSELRQSIHELFSRTGDFKLYQVEGVAFASCTGKIALQGGGRLSKEMLKDMFLQSCGNREKTHAEVTSFDRLEHVFDKMNLDSQVAMFRAAREDAGGKFVLTGADYVEAQIGKPVTVDDIAEIRLPAENYEPGSEKRQSIEAWSSRTGVKVTFFSYKDIVNSANRLVAMNTRHTKNLNDVLSVDIQEVQERVKAEVNMDWADRYVADRPELAKAKPFLEPGPFLRAAALSKFLERVHHTLARNEKTWSTSETQTRNGVEAAARKFLDAKLGLLSVASDYEFDTVEQKRAFLKWVIEAGNIRNANEMRMVYVGANAFKERLLELWRSGADGSEVVRGVAGLLGQMQGLVGEYVGNLENGSDDNAAHSRRFAFMGLAMLQHAGLSEEQFGELKAMLDCSEMRSFRMTFEPMLMEAVSPSITSALTRTQAGTKELACLRLFAVFDQQVQDTLGLPRASERLNQASQVPLARREAFLENYPELKAVLDAQCPVGRGVAVERPAMPAAPASLNALGFAGRRRFLIDHCLPRYHQHEQTFDRDVEYHGRSHATRTFVFAQALGNILREKGVDVNVDALALAAAGHDIGREQNGADYYEAQSAELTAQLVGEQHEMSADFRRALGECITSNAQNAPTVEAWLLHCADSLDYGRLGGFSLNHFPFMQEPLVQDGVVVNPDRRLLQQLAKEADMLQQMTHPRSGMHAEMDRLLEQGATNPERLRDYQELSRLCTDITHRRIENDTDEQVVRRVEDAIRYNPSTFPLLNRYYAG